MEAADVALARKWTNQWKDWIDFEVARGANLRSVLPEDRTAIKRRRTPSKFSG
jgi:hypothetical protein